MSTSCSLLMECLYPGQVSLAEHLLLFLLLKMLYPGSDR
jgi:hypothetical protein